MDTNRRWILNSSARECCCSQRYRVFSYHLPHLLSGYRNHGEGIGSNDFEQEHALNQMGLIWLLKSSLLNRLSGIAFLSLVIVAVVLVMNRNQPAKADDALRQSSHTADLVSQRATFANPNELLTIFDTPL